MAPKPPSQHAAEKAAEAKAAAAASRAAVNEKQFNPSQMAAKKKAEETVRNLCFFSFSPPTSRARDDANPPTTKTHAPPSPRVYHATR
jgi:hypothetical protein